MTTCTCHIALNLDTRHQDQIVNTTPEGSYSAWLNPVQNGKAVGPAKELEVKAGDKIKMSVNAAYLIPNSDNQIVSSFSSVLAYAMGFDPNITETAAQFNAIDGAVGGLAAVADPGDPRQPKAYLQFLFFDKDLNYIPPTTGDSYVPVTTAAGNTATELQNAGQVNHEQLTLEYTAPEDGYMYIYVANESNNDVSVYFDDLTIQQLGLDVLQATDYYPFGLVLERYKKENYAYGYQGQFAEEDTITGWNSFELRMYDPVIARWISPDPYGQFYSPYLAMGNNPGLFDPDGGCVPTTRNPCPQGAAGASAAGGSGASVGSTSSTGGASGLKALGNGLMFVSALMESFAGVQDLKSNNGSINGYEFQLGTQSISNFRNDMECPSCVFKNDSERLKNDPIHKIKVRGYLQSELFTVYEWFVKKVKDDPQMPWNKDDYDFRNTIKYNTNAFFLWYGNNVINFMTQGANDQLAPYMFYRYNNEIIHNLHKNDPHVMKAYYDLQGEINAVYDRYRSIGYDFR